jgi:formate dehydrogenase major subunit
MPNPRALVAERRGTALSGSLARRGGDRVAKRRPRLTTPYVRRDGVLVATTWDEALDAAAAGLAAHGGAAHGMFSCSKATNEVNFMAQKFARVVMGSNNIDSCNRT